MRIGIEGEATSCDTKEDVPPLDHGALTDRYAYVKGVSLWSRRKERDKAVMAVVDRHWSVDGDTGGTSVRGRWHNSRSPDRSHEAQVVLAKERWALGAGSD